MVFDYAIFGGGVVGCAILNKLTRLGKKCILIEKNNDVSTGVTKANTALVHAGFDATPNTLKAKLNVRGNALFEPLCKQLDVPFNRIGALVVGDNKQKIKELYDRGIQNGVPDMEILDKTQLFEKVPNLNPNLNCALFAKSAGIISPYEFCIALAEESVLNHSKVVLNYNANSIIFNGKNYEIFDGNTKYLANYIINCTGAHFNELSKIIGSEIYDIKYRVGEYYLLDSSEIGLTKYSIFPLPSSTSKGVVITPTVDGNILIGPNAEDTESCIPITTKNGLQEVKDNANNILNNIKFYKNIRNFSGVRTIVGKDFVIEKSKLKPNLINVVGICSPGLSASPAIAEYVAKDLLQLHNKEIKMVKRKSIITIKGKSAKEINALISKDKNFGVIVCNCEMVSLAEIIQALNSPLKPSSIDAIKRRTRAGMGRCQGGFCLMKVLTQIAKTRNMKLEDVCKENIGSNIILGNIKEVGKENE